MYFFAGVTLIIAQVVLIGAQNSTYHLAAYPTIFQLISNANKLHTWSDLDNPESRLLAENVKKFAVNVIIEDLVKAFSNEDHAIVANVSNEILVNFPPALSNVTKRTADTFAGNSRSLELLRAVRNIIFLPNFTSDTNSALVLAHVLKFTKNNIIRDLTKAFRTDNYTRVSDICSQINEYSPIHFSDLIKRAIKGSFSKILQNTAEFFECFNQHEIQVQSANVYSAMIEEFVSRDKLNESMVITLAINFKNVYYKLCSTNGDSKDCKDLTDLFSAWPSFLSGLVTDKPMCIQSKETENYVYNVVDSTREVRSVFKIPNVCVENVTWVLEPYKNALRIKSFDSNGYLSGSDKVYLDSISELNVVSTQWLVERHSNNDMFIKNLALNPEKYVYVGLNNPDFSRLLKHKESVQSSIFTYDQIPSYNVTETDNRTKAILQDELNSVNVELKKLYNSINKHYLLLSENKYGNQSLWTIGPCNDVAC